MGLLSISLWPTSALCSFLHYVQVEWTQSTWYCFYFFFPEIQHFSTSSRSLRWCYWVAGFCVFSGDKKVTSHVSVIGFTRWLVVFNKAVQLLLFRAVRLRNILPNSLSSSIKLTVIPYWGDFLFCRKESLKQFFPLILKSNCWHYAFQKDCQKIGSIPAKRNNAFSRN